jgi:hypothetical protein
MKLPRYRLMQFDGFRIFCFLLSFLCLASCATVPERAEHKASVAVWEIEDLSPGGNRLDIGELFSARIMEVLKSKGDYTVVERTRILRVLEELRLGSSALADEQTRLRVGKLVGARVMVFGGYLVIGGNMRLDLRLVEVETGKVLKAVQKTASSNDTSGWLDAAGRAAAEL